MIVVSDIETFNWDAAIRGMRNPLNSWEKTDSFQSFFDTDKYIVGENDLTLMKKLVHSGPEHRKFLRQIFISMDIIAPLYWWKEFDTYKVGTVADSCSTMHKITSKKFVKSDFSCEHLDQASREVLDAIITRLNSCRELYVNYDIYASKARNLPSKKEVWWQLIQLLPSSYNQKRTVSMNYENALSMIRQRSNHKLDEWREFVRVLLNNLPYMRDLISEPK